MTTDNSGNAQRRKWLGVISHCCGVYTRVYLNSSGEWAGNCARCARRIVRVML
ncbi:MAG: hypothetical protein FWC26_02670 [Fibromonadales bacterium]|nr:hypothetical protein [Fibromonadales bacterium]